jgi:hypothetical protein
MICSLFFFLPSLPLTDKTQHWTCELQRQLAVKRGDRMLVNFPHCICFPVQAILRKVYI